MLSNSVDEPPPPYLVAGTEVSAKFKGAFCEAKISRVEKNVRCKITYKQGGQQATVSDEQIRSSLTGQALALNEFKPGTIVSVLKGHSSNVSESAEPECLATLNKVTDQSAYTVIFNDGDEKILRRTFIRFKGEKHYLDSETLNNAPLNNPEHFLYPIKQNSSADQVTTKSSPNTSQKRTATAAANSDGEESIGEEENKPKKPALAKKCRTVSKDFDEIDEPRQDIAPVQEPEEEESDSESDSSSSSDDYPSEIKDRFVAQLYKFMDDRGTPMNRLPTINCVDIDLHRFFIVVRKYGGYNKVCKLRNWVDVYKRLNLPNISHSSNVINLKCAYKRYLQPFEDFYRKLGSTMHHDLVTRHSGYSTNNSKRNTSDSHRSLQLFKNRVFTPNSVVQKRGINKLKQKQVISSPSTTSNQTDTSQNEIKSEPTTSAVASHLIDQHKESIDSTADIDLVKNEYLESTNKTGDEILASSGKSTQLDDQQTQQQEEITLFSMVRNLNENFKKAKRQEKEKKEKTSDDDIATVPAESLPSSLTTPSSSLPSKKSTPYVSSSPKTKVQEIISNKKKPSSSSQSSSSSSTSSLLCNKINQKPVPLSKEEEENNESPDEESLDEIKPKRKVNRLSVSGSDEAQTILETKKNIGMKRKNSAGNCSSISTKQSNNNATSSSNTETNDESEDYQASNDADLNEGEYKTNLTINDLEVNKIVDVKYANGSQKRDYKAKIMQINTENQTVYVHYLGWNNRYDEWVKMDRIKRMLNENYNSHRRRKSIKCKNQSVGSPTSSVSSHPNDSPSHPSNSKETDIKKSTAKKSNDFAVKLIKKKERLSSSSTTSSLNDQLKEEPHQANESVSIKTNLESKSHSKTSQNEKAVKLCNSDSTSSDCSKANLNELKSQQIELQDSKTECNPPLIAIDSLLSIKEEIIESENLISEQQLPNESEHTEINFNNKLENESELIEKFGSKTSNNKSCHKTAESLNSQGIQENNKSQTIKSPNSKATESSRQITHQPTTDKVLNNQTNYLNENHTNHIITAENEEELKNKSEIKSQTSNNATTISTTNEENGNGVVLTKKTDTLHNSQQQLFIDNCKYSFNLNDVNLIGKQRIRYIEEQMRLCRDMYAKVKNEIAAIDRKKKKLKRSTFENINNKSGYLNGLTSSSSSINNDDSVPSSNTRQENLKAQKN